MPYALTLNKTRPSRQERGKTKNRISKRLGKLFVLEQEKKTHTFPQLLCTSSNKTNYTHTQTAHANAQSEFAKELFLIEYPPINSWLVSKLEEGLK